MPRLTAAQRAELAGIPIGTPHSSPEVIAAARAAHEEKALAAEREFQEGPGGDGVIPAYVPPRIDPPAYDPKKKPVTTITVRGTAVPWMSGFCQGEAQVNGVLEQQMGPDSRQKMHARCPGAFTSGNGTTTLCQCPEHIGELRCSVCGHVDDEDGWDADRRRCLDVEACADRLHEQATAAANTPLARQLREVKATHGRDMVANPIAGAPRASSSTRRVGRPCQCGCGVMTGGGLFRPGHDAKLKSRLQKEAKEGDNAAATELEARGWPVPEGGNLARIRLGSTEAAAAYIDKRVAERYAAGE